MLLLKLLVGIPYFLYKESDNEEDCVYLRTKL